VVTLPSADDEAYYQRLEESWPAERASRKKKRRYERKRDRRVEVYVDPHEEPSASRMSKALLAAQRELAQRQREADARAETEPEDHDANG
jgi:hypothetical protein